MIFEKKKRGFKKEKLRKAPLFLYLKNLEVMLVCLDKRRPCFFLNCNMAVINISEKSLNCPQITSFFTKFFEILNLHISITANNRPIYQLKGKYDEPFVS